MHRLNNKLASANCFSYSEGVSIDHISHKGSGLIGLVRKVVYWNYPSTSFDKGLETWGSRPTILDSRRFISTEPHPSWSKTSDGRCQRTYEYVRHMHQLPRIDRQWESKEDPISSNILDAGGSSGVKVQLVRAK